MGAVASYLCPATQEKNTLNTQKICTKNTPTQENKVQIKNSKCGFDQIMVTSPYQSQKIIKWDSPWFKNRFLEKIVLPQFSLFCGSEREIRGA